MPGGVAPKFGSEKVSRYTGVSQLQLRVSRYTVQLSLLQCHLNFLIFARISLDSFISLPMPFGRVPFGRFQNRLAILETIRLIPPLGFAEFAAAAMYLPLMLTRVSCQGLSFLPSGDACPPKWPLKKNKSESVKLVMF